jgi:hypothetical protein
LTCSLKIFTWMKSSFCLILKTNSNLHFTTLCKRPKALLFMLVELVVNNCENYWNYLTLVDGGFWNWINKSHLDKSIPLFEQIIKLLFCSKWIRERFFIGLKFRFLDKYYYFLNDISKFVVSDLKISLNTFGSFNLW